MPLTSYQSIADVLKEFQIRSVPGKFILPKPMEIRQALQDDLDLTFEELTFNEGESAACEMIIFPILREVYRHYRQNFTLWSHKTMIYNDKLTGTPDYILAQKSPLGKEVFDKPFWVAIEAKKDDFILGWGQCLAEMVAIQRINEWGDDRKVFGIVTNGKFWEFGYLIGNHFTQEINSYMLADLPNLIGALNYVFSECELALSQH